jgi:hypothetical protein
LKKVLDEKALWTAEASLKIWGSFTKVLLLLGIMSLQVFCNRCQTFVWSALRSGSNEEKIKFVFHLHDDEDKNQVNIDKFLQTTKLSGDLWENLIFIEQVCGA